MQLSLHWIILNIGKIHRSIAFLKLNWVAGICFCQEEMRYEIVCEPQQCLIVNFEFSKPKMNACFSNKFPSFIYLQSSAAAMDYNANISSAKLFEEINLHILKIAWNSCYMLDWIANLQSYTSCWWWVCNMRTYVQCAYQIYKWFQWMRFIVEEATWGL